MGLIALAWLGMTIRVKILKGLGHVRFAEDRHIGFRREGSFEVAYGSTSNLALTFSAASAATFLTSSNLKGFVK